MRRRKQLVLVVVDAMKPAMLERAIAAGRAPAMARIRDEGVYVGDCAAAFPSVTPVCAATITTGAGPDRHGIPSMNWYHREEGRYVEYGSSFSASRQFGLLRSLTDTVYRMNAEHLCSDTPTVFESLDDLGLRTAGTTYLIYRGRHEHDVAQESALARLVTSTLFRRTVMAPREFFYADLYASRRTGCHGALGMPGVRDQHTGCVGSYLIEHDLFDFMLFSLPDNDAVSHRLGPQAQLTSLAAADRQLERLMHAAGGPDRFLDDYAVIVTSDHSHA
ncbi:MAG: alkaline phosphatase family protein, partial [Solirubrobacteraceae bacterium]